MIAIIYFIISIIGGKKVQNNPNAAVQQAQGNLGKCYIIHNVSP